MYANFSLELFPWLISYLLVFFSVIKFAIIFINLSELELIKITLFARFQSNGSGTFYM